MAVALAGPAFPIYTYPDRQGKYIFVLLPVDLEASPQHAGELPSAEDGQAGNDSEGDCDKTMARRVPGSGVVDTI